MAEIQNIVTVTLNTAIDRVLEVANLSVGAHVRGRQLRRYAAGKGINVSRALARLGRPNIATGFVGRDDLDFYERFLGQTGPGRISCQLLTVRGRTRENVTLVDPVNHIDTHIRDEGFEVPPRDLQRMVSKLQLLARPNSVFVFSGSLPQGVDVEHLRQLVAVADEHDVRAVLDVDGDLLRQMGDPGRNSAPKIWMVKPNLSELAELAGQESLVDDSHLLKAITGLTRWVSWVVVTLGAKGAWLVTEGRAWRGHVDTDQNSVVNTVGCGDSMVAGVLDAQLAGVSPDAVLRRGLAVATANALSPGVADFNSRQVRQLEAKVHIDERKWS